MAKANMSNLHRIYQSMIPLFQR